MAREPGSNTSMTKQYSVKKLEELSIGETTALRVAVWRVRTSLRDKLKGRDVLDVENGKSSQTGRKIRYIYRQIDEFMARFFPSVTKVTPKHVALARVRDMLHELDYTIVEADEARPWGAFYRMADDQAERFIGEFFPGLSMRDAQLGKDELQLSPKILIVSPGQRLSWQYHHRRAERWRFLTPGAYYRSDDDEPGDKIIAEVGTSVQFGCGERHRLSAKDAKGYVLVAEIWQHTDPDNPSSEDDIVRLADDYKR